MPTEYYLLSIEEAADATALDVRIVRQYAELGLITPSERGYAAAELAALRSVRRLRDDLELSHEAIEIILRMRRRIEALQTDLQQMQRDLRAAGRSRPAAWEDAEWRDLE